MRASELIQLAKAHPIIATILGAEFLFFAFYFGPIAFPESVIWPLILGFGMTGITVLAIGLVCGAML